MLRARIVKVLSSAGGLQPGRCQQLAAQVMEATDPGAGGVEPPPAHAGSVQDRPARRLGLHDPAGRLALGSMAGW